MLYRNASELEKSKYEICQNITRYKRINELSLKNLDDILYCRINLLKLDDLASYLEKLGITFHLEIEKKRGVTEKRI